MVRVTVFVDDLDRASRAGAAALSLCEYLAGGQAQCDLILASRDLPRPRCPCARNRDHEWADLRRRWLAGDAWLIALGTDSALGPLADFLHRTLSADDPQRRPFLLLVNSQVHERAIQADNLTARLIGAGGVGCAPPLVFRGCANAATRERPPEDGASRLRCSADWLVAVTTALQALH